MSEEQAPTEALDNKKANFAAANRSIIRAISRGVELEKARKIYGTQESFD